jgi:uncharacterized protein YeaO (DUF488 family)
MPSIIKTKSIYDEKQPQSDGVRVLVTRFYPRGVKKDRFDLWKREASPEVPLLKAYRSKSITWQEFEKRFRAQLRTRKESLQTMQELLQLAKKRKIITLLCYEREGEHCHRYIVKERLVRSLSSRVKK